MNLGQLVMGPAGCGKSTYCLETYKNLTNLKNSVTMINLDPSIENLEYPDSIDIRDLIKIEDVMEEFSLGPNGGLIFCMEYFMDNLAWFDNQMDLKEKTNLIFDLPGQIELYTHCSLIRDFANYLKKTTEISLYSIFLLDCQFIGDLGKFFGGTITALCCMLSLEIPHFNILTKIDLINHIPYSVFEKFLFPCHEIFSKELHEIIDPKYRKLTRSLVKLLIDFSMVQFIPLDLTRPEQLTNFLDLLKMPME
ncbi:fet5 (nucleomorph) [Hemiselmis andersenii]|uniref:GPN-loop GTPase 3 n=1 Tax=Hemiselmis andersenii TaxID=464988 RepID=A9BKS5_HEMAN|nr:fet5 [Hemiselmis andersenii]ABW98080.1 fet5 [Hemiselmis andersenii]|mmetsp:Transcript_10066/g.23548  ORF Transcript_10066/g.23548 Transcript_10066/m.23548 type:complete len:251 (-) Transcript_10066:679-1431(-)